ncbi:hypothetical protein JIN84_13660 [Luteolibacter yonseiensis]|uniref:STAS/SEC14 domain-containing protein n=1 Tax=Luteolibacter yonseiensis TaxID=1144680 RepID=A0A934V7Y7_9BACT|nr:hypothetical protein [Luteolibacter yonseiensis]MBK1816667.1 hypothetical protein [Luteolibacter yonseiensis]
MRFLQTYDSCLDAVGSYWIDNDRRLRIEKYHGKTGLADLKAVQCSIAADPAWRADFHGLIDFSEADLDISANEILRLALVMRHGPSRSHGWLAYVVTHSATHGAVRMLCHWMRATDRMRIFKTRAEAEIWLARNIYQIPPAFISEVELRNVG